MSRPNLLTTEAWAVHRPKLDDPLFAVVLDEALGWPPLKSPRAARLRMVEFRGDAGRRSLQVEAFAATDAASRPIAAVVSVESPGQAALLMTPAEFGNAPPGVMQALFSAALDLWQRRGVLMGQLLLHSHGRQARDLAARSGFRFLTQLVYMERAAGRASNGGRAAPVEWLSYSADTEPQFLSTIAATYTQSMDCPELTGIRPVRDVLLGHKAAGEFDPHLWWLAVQGDQSVGVLLLASLPKQQALEVAYMGVVPSSRGKGVAPALMGRACECVTAAGARSLILAVDARNAVARRLYEKWGFVRFAARDAWIVTTDGHEGCDQSASSPEPQRRQEPACDSPDRAVVRRPSDEGPPSKKCS